MKVNNRYSGSRIVIVSHIYTTGPSHMLECYLRNKGAEVLFLGHPFHFAPEPRSHYRWSQSGKTGENHYVNLFFRNDVINVIKDSLLTLWCVMKSGKFDAYVGIDGVNAVMGVLLKKLGIVRRVIYYTIDFVPKRFSFAPLNALYLWLDRVAVSGSDIVWNLSGRMTQEREKYGLSKAYRSKQHVVPMGTEGFQKKGSRDTYRKNSIAHMGHLVPVHGVSLLIQALPEIVKKVPSAHLEILGGGPEEDDLKRLASQMNVARYITFHGYIKSHDELLTMLSECAVGVAPYVDSADSFIRNSDPGKVKAYLDAGLPVIVTKVPDVWRELEKYKAGVGIEYDIHALSDAVIWILSDEKRLSTYREGANVMSRKYRWENIYTKALSFIDLGSRMP